MKFLAILRDSLREAIDVKVFYVMIGLSMLLTLFAFSIGFKPRPPEESLAWIANTTLNAKLTKEVDPNNLAHAFMVFGRFAYCEVSQVEALDPGVAPADSRYRFVLKRKSADGAFHLGGNLEERLRADLGRLGSLRLVEVQDIKRIAQSETFEVTVAPTPATRLIWVHDASILFGAVPIKTGTPLGGQLYFIESGLVLGIGGWVTLLISVIITAFFIPNMLRKGTIEPLVVKPIRRWQLLVYKYIGGLTFIFLNTLIAVGGVWLALSLRSGIWATGFLYTILTLTFFFAILYAVSALFGVMTLSPVASILLTMGTWFVLFLVGLGYQFFEISRLQEETTAAMEKRQPEEQGWFAATVRGAHFILPRTGDLNVLNSRLVQQDLLSANQLAGQDIDPMRISWTETLSVSGAFIALCLYLACWQFTRRDC